MSQPLRVLVVGSDEPGRRALIEALAQAGVHGEPVATLDALEARAALGAGAEPGADGPFDPDAILAAHGLGALDGFAALNWVQQRHPDWPVLLYDRSPTVETTIRAIHGGAHDLLRWPGPADPLVAAVRRAARQRHSSRAPRPATPEAAPTALVGASIEMVEVFRQVARAARSDVPVLVLGESGTGKELVAQAIHAHSARNVKPLVTVNCGALTESLLESELFGHVRGAFTGADRPRAGLFAEADGGTLFLDEIGEISQRLQVRLLRALQSGEIRPVGADQNRTVDVRVIAATHRNLRRRVEQGHFRQDLYYRLDVMSVRVPPLRDRPDDIGPLVDRFLRRAGGRALTLAEDALSVLQSHHWPGNVRELENVIARAAAVSPGPLITLDDLPAELLAHPPEQPTGDEGAVRTLAQVEQDYVRRILARCHGNKTRAAQLLGIDRKTLGRVLAR